MPSRPESRFAGAYMTLFEIVVNHFAADDGHETGDFADLFVTEPSYNPCPASPYHPICRFPRCREVCTEHVLRCPTGRHQERSFAVHGIPRAPDSAICVFTGNERTKPGKWLDALDRHRLAARPPGHRHREYDLHRNHPTMSRGLLVHNPASRYSARRRYLGAQLHVIFSFLARSI